MNGIIEGRSTSIAETLDQNGRGLSQGSPSPETVTDATAAVYFSIGGTLRFLSHAETLRVFQRACARAEVPVKFTEGFNPHPKLSLPLPRPVGVESDDELLVLRLFDEDGIPLGPADSPEQKAWLDKMKPSLAGELPDSIRVDSVVLAKSNASFVAESADYEFPLRPDVDRREIIDGLLARESVVVERLAPKRRERRIDVRGFLKSLSVKDDLIVVTCAITAGGSIRVDEILELLDLTAEDLAGPVRRTNVRWTSR